MHAAAERAIEPSEAASPGRPSSSHSGSLVVVIATGAIICAAVALLATIGADARWLAALGRIIAGRDSIPSGVPYAAAPSRGWHNAIALAQLAFDGLHALLGDRGLVVAQLLAVAAALTEVALDGLASGATPSGLVPILGVVSLGAASSLVVVRVQLFSLALFPLLVLLLRREARRPSRRIWLVLPLLAVWSNLHGAVLIGLLVTVLYLVLRRSRGRPLTAVAIGLAAPAAVCLTPAGLSTIAYYHGVLSNEAAARGEGLWAPLSLGRPLDLVLIATATTLCVRLRRSGLHAWEWASILILTALTVETARSGVWLLLFIAAPAARTVRRPDRRRPVLLAGAAVAAGALVIAVVRGPIQNGAGARLLHRAIAIADGRPVLAEDIVAEQLALAGGKVWMANPIDAFPRRAQRAYLDWVDGRSDGIRRLAPRVAVVVTLVRSPSDRLMKLTPGFTLIAADRRADMFVPVR